MNYYHLQQRFLGNAHGTLDPEIQEFEFIEKVPTGILVKPVDAINDIKFAISEEKIGTVTVSPAESGPRRFDQYLHTIVGASNIDEAKTKAKHIFQDYYESIKDEAAEYQMKAKMYAEKEEPELW